ncbi:MAG TPA: hypothetical protein DF774_10585 [Rheinheimera sp.]|nr:hypothetical protein [Rheinheimera sp.]
MKTMHTNRAAVALLWTQDLLLIQASRMPKADEAKWLHAAKTPILMLHYASENVQEVATRISNARIERFVRNRHGRRLPA